MTVLRASAGPVSRHGAAFVLVVLAAGCAGRSKLEVSGSGGAAGTAGTAGTGGSGAAGAPACAADVRTDPAHCGRCFHSCEGGDCVDGACQPVTLVAGLERPATALALDAEHVWFTSPVTRVSKDFGNQREPMAMTNGDVWSLATDGDYAFWINISGGLQRLDSGTREVHEFGDPGYHLALDELNVYFTSSFVGRYAKDASEWQVLADMPGEAIAVDELFVYFTVPKGGGLFRVEKTGGMPVALMSNTSASYIAVLDGDVFVSEHTAPAGVFRVNGVGLRTLVASVQNPYGVAADRFGVFWADWLDGSIWWRAHDEGAEPRKLASGQPFPRDIAVDARAVYWTNDDVERSVMKVAKP